MVETDLYASDETIEFDGDDVRLVLSDRSSTETLVTFTVRPQPGRPFVGFASKIARDHQLNSAYIIAKRPHWWQSPEMGQVVEILREAPITNGAHETLAYGASMGGFGAMLFAGRIGCKRALLISPQVSVDPTIVPFEHRWDEDLPQIEFLESDGRDGITGDCKYTVFFDPRDANDTRHALMIPDTNNIEKVRVPFGGHTLPELLLQTGVLKQLVFAALRDKVVINEIRLKIRQKRAFSTHYFDMLSRYAIARQRRTVAVGSALRWLALAPASKDAFARAIKACREAGQLARIEDLAREFTIHNPEEASGWRVFRQSLYENMNYIASYQAAVRAVESKRAIADDYRWCVRLCLRLGKPGEGLDWFLRASTRFPNDGPLRIVGAQAYRALGLEERASKLEQPS